MGLVGCGDTFLVAIDHSVYMEWMRDMGRNWKKEKRENWNFGGKESWEKDQIRNGGGGCDSYLELYIDICDNIHTWD